MKKVKIIKISAVLSALSGIVILMGSFWPIISYQINEGRNNNTFLSPLVPQIGEYPKDDTSADYTKASNWFPEDSGKREFNKTKVSFYNISIPKLKIEDATVAIGGEDLSENLVQYPGTALPGKPGNSVIFGHSILPIFYDPKNYMAIFSTLPSLREDDEIKINFDGISYTYKVEEKFEIYPTDIQILQQDVSDSFLTLVTCVPPGDPRKPKRLIVRARVVPSELANTGI